ncbi:MAG: DNA polymerase III subunit alpha [Bdellovibrionales bacterium]
MSFSHLHSHSHYSLLKCSSSIPALVKKNKSLGYEALALTDMNNMFGAVEFYFAAKKEGLKPIVGLDISLSGKFIKSPADSYSLVLLAQNYKGYQELSRIVSFAHKKNNLDGVQRATIEVVRDNSKNVIALTGGHEGVLVQTFLKEGPEKAEERLLKLKEIFQDRLYIEINRHGLDHESEFLPFAMEISEKHSIELVAANDTRYTENDDLVPHNILIGAGSNRTLDEVTEQSSINGEFYVKSKEAMEDLLPGDRFVKALNNTQVIVDRCNIEFILSDADGKPIYHLPTFPTKGGRSSKDEIREIAFQGLEERLSFLEKQTGEKLSPEQKKVYTERLEYELSVIDGMGFNGYFLIVQDFIRWSKENNIPVGPGRGSGAGSLVAYCLSITDLNPIPYALIFERFLNPERVSMPDFDIDFCQERRGEVIEYVTKTYGEQSVSQIITYGKLQTRAALRDVGRVLGFSFMEVNDIAKLIPDVLGISLQEALDTEPRLKDMMGENPQVHKLISLALKVEGLVRHAGIHAAGVIIADGDIVDHAPVTTGADGENVVQFDMKNSEKIGLIKFDFLGLKTLTHIQYGLNFIKKTKGKDIKAEDISIDDPGIYELMSKGDNHGVFQFESEGITDLTIKAKPSCFTDIVALNALYRPGPMEMIPDYLQRKSGKKKVEYLFPELEEILKETYGIVVYQEHVQLIASKIASYSLGEADMLRRAMGKKIAEEMAQQKVRFLKGASDNKFDPKKAEILFDLMAEFAKYGFNKSHAAAYCVVTAQTAWLKHYYPVEFFAALLTTEISNTENVTKYVKDAKKHDIEVVPPHINTSRYEFDTDGEKLFFSLGAIKGVGQNIVELIVEARESLPNKKFESLEEFFSTVDTKKFNKRSIESLSKAGAFDGYGYTRSELFAEGSKFLEAAEKKRKEREIGQFNLFDTEGSEDDSFNVTISKKPEWDNRAKLQLEKEVLGFYLTKHPLEAYSSLRSSFKSISITKLDEEDHKKEVTVFGVIPKTKEFITKKGSRMAFAEAEDEDGSIELIVFPDVFKEVEGILTEEKPLLISGTFEVQEGKGGKILVTGIEDPIEQLKKARSISLFLENPEEAEIDEFFKLAGLRSGDTKIHLNLDLALDGTELDSKVKIDVLEPEGVEIDFDFLDSLGKIFKGYRGLEVGV